MVPRGGRDLQSQTEASTEPGPVRFEPRHPHRDLTYKDAEVQTQDHEQGSVLLLLTVWKICVLGITFVLLKIPYLCDGCHKN